MNYIIRLSIIILTLFSFPEENFGQIVLGPAASRFSIYTSSGAVSDNPSAHSLVTGDVGTNGGGVITANSFGNVNGVMHNGNDAATTACFTALAATVAQINADTVGTIFLSGTLGNGVTFIPGVYSIPANATLGLNLILDAQGNPNKQFIIKIGGTFSASSNAKVILTNGALACNVYWKIVNTASFASNVTMRGNVICGGAISMATGDSIEGRLFTTAGAINIDKITAFTPAGCNSNSLSGPPRPDLASTECYTIFSSIGALQNTIGTTTVIGDVGKNTNGSAISGWGVSAVTGTLHVNRDSSTIYCAADLSKLYDSLNAMVPDIELLYPSQLGHNLTLTPHVYLVNSGGANGPAALTDSIYLDAQGNANGVFVIKIIGGSITTSTYSMVKLINGAQSKNVFWMVSSGAVSINNYSVFRGTIVVAAGAINLINTGVMLDGRALAMNGAITTQGLTAIMPPGCSLSIPTTIITQPLSQSLCAGKQAVFTVIATGSGLSYQWRKGTVNLVNGANISGANTDVLKIDNISTADIGSNYNVVVTGFTSVTSNNVSLTALSIPVITATTPNSICGPGAVTLGALSNAGTINWFATLSGGTTLGTGSSYTTPVISANNTYYVDATQTGCITAARTAVLATIKTIPSITGTTPGSVTGSGTVILGAIASAGTINWYAEPTGGTSIGTGINFTTPVLTVSDTFYTDATLLGCITPNRTQVIATVISNTGINTANAALKAIAIYPNPFSSSLNIVLYEGAQLANCELIIFNILGSEMLHKTITEKTTNIETANLTAGVYFYKMNINNKMVQTGKLVAQ